MTRLEKCELAKERGYTYDPKTGKIYGARGREIGNIRKDGYIQFRTFGITQILAHHFAWYMIYGNVDFEMLDHINTQRSDNRISNLRIADNQLNQQNRLNSVKGYWFDKKKQKYKTIISINRKQINGGYFETKEEAHNRYLELKKIYHTK